MKVIRFAVVLVLFLAIAGPDCARAEWKVYFTGKAAANWGTYGRGNFTTKSQCEAYRSSSAGFERNNSYCSGSDTPTARSSAKKSSSGVASGIASGVVAGMLAAPAAGAANSAAADSRAAEQARQLQMQREQKQKEADLARQQQFEEGKEQLLSAFKGDGTGTGGLGFKLPPAKDVQSPASVDPDVLREQDEFASSNAAWMDNQKKRIRQRLEEPNKWSDSIYASLKTKAPPLPYKSFNELQTGDVLLISPDAMANSALNKTDRALSGSNLSDASHTVLYLKEINGKKLFLENIPGEGPRIILEDEFFKRYGQRDAQVASLARYGVAQPLDRKEGDRLYAAAREMTDKNRSKEQAGGWLDKTGYGTWGKDDVVCSEADWALLKAAGRNIPKSDDRIKGALGVDFSPADFYGNGQYFLVSPLGMSK